MTSATSPASGRFGLAHEPLPEHGGCWHFSLNSSENRTFQSSSNCWHPYAGRPSTDVAMDMDEVKEQVVRLASRIRDCEGRQLAFWCPACGCAHVINRTWQFNGDYMFPTIQPSILVEGRRWIGKEDCDPLNQKFWLDVRCHSYVRDGKITYLEDSKHAMSGKTVDIPVFP